MHGTRSHVPLGENDMGKFLLEDMFLFSVSGGTGHQRVRQNHTHKNHDKE